MGTRITLSSLCHAHVLLWLLFGSDPNSALPEGCGPVPGRVCQANTQGQSETVSGLAYLLAMQLMPRIRHLKHLTLYAPRERFALEHMAHIRELLTGTMHWGLITTHLPDMLREALSISQGKV